MRQCSAGGQSGSGDESEAQFVSVSYEPAVGAEAFPDRRQADVGARSDYQVGASEGGFLQVGAPARPVHDAQTCAEFRIDRGQRTGEQVGQHGFRGRGFDQHRRLDQQREDAPVQTRAGQIPGQHVDAEPRADGVAVSLIRRGRAVEAVPPAEFRVQQGAQPFAAIFLEHERQYVPQHRPRETGRFGQLRFGLPAFVRVRVQPTPNASVYGGQDVVHGPPDEMPPATRQQRVDNRSQFFWRRR